MYNEVASMLYAKHDYFKSRKTDVIARFKTADLEGRWWRQWKTLKYLRSVTMVLLWVGTTRGTYRIIQLKCCAFVHTKSCSITSRRHQCFLTVVKQEQRQQNEMPSASITEVIVSISSPGRASMRIVEPAGYFLPQGLPAIWVPTSGWYALAKCALRVKMASASHSLHPSVPQETAARGP
jgi:hypothetical protein